MKGLRKVYSLFAALLLSLSVLALSGCGGSSFVSDTFTAALYTALTQGGVYTAPVVPGFTNNPAFNPTFTTGMGGTTGALPTNTLPTTTIPGVTGTIPGTTSNNTGVGNVTTGTSIDTGLGVSTTGLGADTGLGTFNSPLPSTTNPLLNRDTGVLPNLNFSPGLSSNTGAASGQIPNQVTGF